MQAEPRPPGTIEAFTGRGYRVGGIVYPAGVIVTADGAADWEAATLADVAPEDFAAVTGPVLLILGTGPAFARPDPALAAALGARGVTLEPMDSRAAARTYNLLLAEARPVAAALLPHA